MMDLSDKGSECEDTPMQGSECEDTSGGGGGGASLKTCVDCGTSRTPLWRGGPAGPKSLCNACGIRSRKKRRVLVGGISDKKKKSATKKSSSDSSNSCTSSIGDSTVPLIKKKVWALGREVALQRPRSNAAARRRKFGREEEQAAFLLMALSCGSVYA